MASATPTSAAQSVFGYTPDGNPVLKAMTDLIRMPAEIGIGIAMMPFMIADSIMRQAGLSYPQPKR